MPKSKLPPVHNCGGLCPVDIEIKCQKGNYLLCTIVKDSIACIDISLASLPIISRVVHALSVSWGDDSKLQIKTTLSISWGLAVSNMFFLPCFALFYFVCLFVWQKYLAPQLRFCNSFQDCRRSPSQRYSHSHHRCWGLSWSQLQTHAVLREGLEKVKGAFQ